MQTRQTYCSKVANENDAFTVICVATVNGWARNGVSLQRLAADFEIQRSRLDQTALAEYRSRLGSVARRFRTARIISGAAIPYAGKMSARPAFLGSGDCGRIRDARAQRPSSRVSGSSSNFSGVAGSTIYPATTSPRRKKRCSSAKSNSMAQVGVRTRSVAGVGIGRFS